MFSITEILEYKLNSMPWSKTFEIGLFSEISKFFHHTQLFTLRDNFQFIQI